MTTVDNNDECDSVWSREQDKAFENALATHTEESSERWEKITVLVPGKSMDEIKHHYELLLEDINGIECGRVPLPCYPCSSEGLGSVDPAGEGTGSSKKTGLLGNVQGDSNPAGKVSRADQERRKGIAWTEEEHRLFLLGLDKYGKGDWRSISRNFVVSRTPTQVASHAQKYFIRLNSMNRDRRRSSIHDITSVGNGDAPSPQGPMTGQSNGLTATKHSGHPPAVSNSGVGVYGNGTTTIGQPVAGPMVCAVGTPVNLPAAPPHMAYGMRPPLPGTVVPGAPMSYTLPHSSGHR